MEAFGGLAGIGVLFGGLGFAYSQFRSGASKAKDELINTLKEALSVEKEKVETLEKEKIEMRNFHQEQINSLNERVGKLQGLYEEARERNKDYIQILQGRAPEQTEFMKFMTGVAKDSAEYMKSSSLILKDLSTSVKKLADKVDK